MQPSGDWDFPNGTVLMKNFSIGSRLMETRLQLDASVDRSGVELAQILVEHFEPATFRIVVRRKARK